MKKLAIYLFISAIITMIIGLILIGTAKSGFLTLKLYGIGAIFHLNATTKQYCNSILGTNFPVLQAGAVFAGIITPILFISSVGIGGYLYLNNLKKLINTLVDNINNIK